MSLTLEQKHSITMGNGNSTNNHNSDYVYTIKTNNQNNVVVPWEVVHVIAEEGVTFLKASAFKNRRRLKSIKLPQSLEAIGDEVFRGCRSLECIIIPRNVTVIGWWAIDECSKLHSVLFAPLSKLEKIGILAFHNCDSLQSVVIPKSVSLMSSSAFSYCTNLKSVIFETGSKLKRLESYVFNHCSSLKSIVIPDAVTVLADGTFSSCTDLRSVYFTPNAKLETIRPKSFGPCPNLQFVNIPTTVQVISVKSFDKCPTSSLQVMTFPIDVRTFSYDNGTHFLNTPRFENLHLHDLCYRTESVVGGILDSTETNDPALLAQDEIGLTPLHILCSNPQSITNMIKLLYDKSPEAVAIVNYHCMNPWHMYLIQKSVISNEEFRKWYHRHHHQQHEDKSCRKETKYDENNVEKANEWVNALLNENVNHSLHSLIGMGLEYDVVYTTLILHDTSFYKECNTYNETTGVLPFMAMASR